MSRKIIIGLLIFSIAIVIGLMMSSLAEKIFNVSKFTSGTIFGITLMIVIVSICVYKEVKY
jgi:hypothetical protein